MKAQRLQSRPQLLTLEERDVPTSLGGLDPSFAVAGKANFTLAAGTNQANAILIQPDGKILLAGTTDATTPSNADFFVTRHNTDGSFDTTFGSNGKVIFGEANKDDVVTGLAVGLDGSIYASGYTNRGANYDFAIFKLNANGGLNPAFGTNGIKIINIVGDDKAAAIELTKSSVVVVGSASIGLGDDVALVALNFDGTFDPNFAGGAAKVFGLGFAETTKAMAIDADGSILVGGFQVAGAATDMFAMRVLADGSGTATGFGSTDFFGAKFTKIDFNGFADKAYALELDFAGNVLIAGSAGTSATATDFAVVSLKGADGSLNTDFNTNGKVTLDMGGNDVATAMMTGFGGRILLSGFALVPGASATDYAVASLEFNGAVNKSFGTEGKAFVDIIGGGSEDKSYASFIDRRGNLVVAGRSLGNVSVARFVTSVGLPSDLLASGSPDGTANLFTIGAIGATGYTTPGTSKTMFNSFGSLVRVAVGDVNGDGFEDRAAVAGPGAASLLTVRSGKDDSVLFSPFNVFETAFTGGLYVSVADLNNDGFAEVIVTPDQSGGPIVVIYDGAKLSAGKTGDTAQIVRFFGITGDPNFRGGARVAAGDVDADGFADLVVSAGFTGGPRIAVFSGKQLMTRTGDLITLLGQPDQSFRLMPDFLAFESTVRNGAFVAVGDLNGDGFADMIFGGGPGGGPRVRAVSGKAMLAVTNLTSLDNLSPSGLQLNNFFAGDQTNRGGIRLTTRDIDGDQLVDLVASSGDSTPSKIFVFRGATLFNNTNPTADQIIDPFASRVLANGVFVG